MNTSMASPLVALASTMLVLACSADNLQAPLEAEPNMSVNSAAAGGATVLRGATQSFLVHFDAARNLLSLHAPSDVCGAGSLNLNDFQFVITPSAIGQFIAQLKSDAEQVAVYNANSLADAGIAGAAGTGGIADIVDFGTFCAFIAGPDRIAEGTVRRVSTFSNASFSARWVGSLDLVAGGTVRLTEVYQLGADAQDPNNPASWVVHVSKILLD